MQIDSSATGNFVDGNFIGTNATGATGIANGIGVEIDAPSNTVGGTAAGAGNLISDNNDTGVLINGAAASGNLIVGNLIGTNASGTAAAPNNFGVFIQAGSTNNTIGGTTGARRQCDLGQHERRRGHLGHGHVGKRGRG